MSPSVNWRRLWLFALIATLAHAPGYGEEPNGGPVVGELASFPGALLVNMSPPFLAGLLLDRDDRTYHAGDAMRVVFRAEQDAFLYLLYHQADGSTRLLFPNAARRDNRVAKSTPIELPTAGDKFRFRAGPPFGVEVLQTVASPTPIPEFDELLTASQAPTALIPAKTIAAVAQRLQQTPGGWAENHVELTIAPGNSDSSAAVPARCGLFIGIGKYSHPEIASTQPALRHSAEAMHEAMLEHGGLDPARTKLITNEHATRANLQQLIYGWLPSVSRPGDTVFVYYSGHAGQHDVGDATEPDGRDETIAPYDLQIGDDAMPMAQRLQLLRESNISDDELARWLQALSGRQVVLILDTCHSGGHIAAKTLFEDAGERVKDVSQLNVLVLASCGPDEQALFEGTPDDTMWFTYFLVQAIKQGKPLTVQQAFASAQLGVREVSKRRNEARIQEPVISDRALLPVIFVPAGTPADEGTRAASTLERDE